MQAPQSDFPQPNFVPVSPRCSFHPTRRSCCSAATGWNLPLLSQAISQHLLDSGNVLDASGGDVEGFPGLVEVDWNGSTVWQYAESRTNYAPHHDFLRIYNPKLAANTTLYIADIMFDEFREPRFAPPALLKRMVRSGYVGRKSGRGFYGWSA